VHHTLCNVLEPRYERLFVPDSFANRAGKGTHRTVERLQQLARRYRYVLRTDIVQHFPSIDHQILLHTLRRPVPEDDVMALVDVVLASGAGVLDDEHQVVWLPGDDLLAACRPRGLPIGNLISQFWSNCYLHPFDQFVTRELGYGADECGDGRRPTAARECLVPVGRAPWPLDAAPPYGGRSRRRVNMVAAESGFITNVIDEGR